MKFQRTTRVISGPTDAAAWLCVLFPLVFFSLLHHFLIVPSGTRLALPTSSAVEQAGRRGEPVEVIAIDESRQVFMRHQAVAPTDLAARLSSARRDPAAPAVLVIEPHPNVSWDQLSELSSLARNAGWTNLILRTAIRRQNEPQPHESPAAIR